MNWSISDLGCFSPQCWESFVFWEIFVTRKECVQTVGGCYKIYHRTMTGLDWEAEILKSYITLILHERWSDFTRLLSRAENESLDPSTTLWLPLAQETTLIWESDTENPTKLSSPTVSWVLTSNTIHVYSIPWCVSSHRPALIILIGLCITRMWKVTPVCSLKAVSAFLHLDRVQHKWALHKCFLMRAMIALVSVVGPSLTEEENQWLLLSNG